MCSSGNMKCWIVLLILVIISSKICCTVADDGDNDVAAADNEKVCVNSDDGDCSNNDNDDDNDQEEEYDEDEEFVLNERDNIVGCNRLNKEPERRILEISDWIEIREVYREVVGKMDSTILPAWDADEDEWGEMLNDNGEIVDDNVPNEQDDEDGFFVPYEVRQTPDGRGRGVFATEDIKNGTVIYRSYYLAAFPDEETFREFLDFLSFEIACDVIAWAYPILREKYAWVNDTDTKKEEEEEDKDKEDSSDTTESSITDGTYDEETTTGTMGEKTYTLKSRLPTVQLDLDNGSFVNHGRTVKEGDNDDGGDNLIANMGCNDDVWDCLTDEELVLLKKDLLQHSHNQIALRDIKKGEEILTDYSTFFRPGKVPWFDIMWKDAWDEDNFGVGLDTTSTTTQSSDEEDDEEEEEDDDEDDDDEEDEEEEEEEEEGEDKESPSQEL